MRKAFRCNDCDEIFDEPQTLSEYHPEVHADETFEVCPHCGSTNFEEVKLEYFCDECGAELTEEDVSMCYNAENDFEIQCCPYCGGQVEELKE